MTNSELALLSLLAETPRHGYELEQLIRERGMRNWTEIAFSSIYFVLDKLVKKGLSSSEIQPGLEGRPNRKVYTITRAGMSTLKQGVIKALRQPEAGGQAFLIALSCQPLLESAEKDSALRARIRELSTLIENLSANPASIDPRSPTHVHAMFEYSLTLLLAERAWLEDYLQHFEKES
jgi:DNA-binding PadR family transcriptional regulator